MRDAVRGVAQSAPQSLQANARLSASEPAPTAPAPPKSSGDDAAKTPLPKSSGGDAAKTPHSKALGETRRRRPSPKSLEKMRRRCPTQSSGGDAAKTPLPSAPRHSSLPAGPVLVLCVSFRETECLYRKHTRKCSSVLLEHRW